MLGALGLCGAVVAALLTKGQANWTFNRPQDPPVVTSTGSVQAGDSLARILAREKISSDTLLPIQKSFSKIFDLRRLQPGHQYEVVTSTYGLFRKFVYKTDPIHTYTVMRSSLGVFDAGKNQLQTVWMEKRISGEVKENLYKTLLQQGYEERFVANMVADLADNIFGWRIDFFTEQRTGDKFDILMEQEYLVGTDTPLWGGAGRILVASYVGQGTRHKENYAFRFQEPGAKTFNFYDQDGKAVQRLFLRAPFTLGAFRVSSGFNLKRFHPILRTYRPHHGIDYAAAKGTPVVAIGDGQIIFAGWKGGYGNCIEIRHPNNYISRYGHLSRFHVRGGRVHQGQRIGYVGATGLATGPHLHFEMLVGGVQRNFLKMHFPSASSVSTKNMPEFRRIRDELLARFSGSVSPSSVAHVAENRETDQ